MAMDKSLRRDQLANQFARTELENLGPVMRRLGKVPEDYSNKQLVDFITLSNNLPQDARQNIDRVVAGIDIARQLLSSTFRYEVDALTGSPEFAQRVKSALCGDPSASIPEDRAGLISLCHEVLAYAEGRK